MVYRLGNKQRIADKIIKYFPSHSIYIEPFFGAGGLYFNKEIVAHNFLNDIDNDVYNLYNVVIKNPDRFRDYIDKLPYHTSIFNEFKNSTPNDEFQRAIRFIYLSNYSYLGASTSMRICTGFEKKYILDNIDNVVKKLSFAKFTNMDAVKFLNTIHFPNVTDYKNVFVYCDPPYINVMNNYSDSYTIDDLYSLIDKLIAMNVKFGISEFDSDIVDKLINKYGLTKIIIGERHNIKNKKTEILIVNYNPELNVDLSLFGS